MKGKRIRTLKELCDAAENRKSVTGWDGFPTHGKPKPAEFVIHMSGSHLLQCFVMGLYIYHPERKKKAPAVRNPEGIDFKRFPIPKGYTVASEKDISSSGKTLPSWKMFCDQSCWDHCAEGMPFRAYWTYLRPLRRGEKGVSV